MKHKSISKKLSYCFSVKSNRAMCGAAPHTPTTKNYVFSGSNHRIAALLAAVVTAFTAAAVSPIRAEETLSNKTYETHETISGIGSVSKMYATAAVMQLADQGKVDLDAPVTEYLPEFRMADKRYQDITVRMLMNHRSGIMGTTAGNFMLYNDRDMETHDTLLRELRTQRLKADPGDIPAYCNDGFELLELITEAVSGESFTDYVEQHICKPLGIQQTGSAWNLFRTDEQVGTFVRSGIRIAPDYCMAIGSGGILSTASDVCKFGSAFFRGNTTLLSEHAKQEMEQTAAADKYEDQFGLGWDTVSYADYEAAGVKVVSKGGDIMHQHAGLVVAPDEKISVAVLSSGGGSMTDELMGMALMDIALEEKGIHVEHPKPQPVETLDTVPESVLAYAGNYLGGDSVCIVSFPEQKYMEITTVSGDKPETKQYLYTTQGNFVLMDGRIESGKAVQAKQQQLLHFQKRRGIDYLCSDQCMEVGSSNRYAASSYTLQRAPEQTVSAEAQTAWDARSGKKYYICNAKYSNCYYYAEAAFTVRTIPEAPGYTNSGRIVDADHLQSALVMPGGRDLRDVEMYRKDGIEYMHLTNNAITAVAEDAMPELPDDLTEVALHSGQAAWYKIGKTPDKTITLDMPEHAAVYVYDAYDHVTYSSYMTDYGNTVPLPENGKIVFLGEDGGTIGITQ